MQCEQVGLFPVIATTARRTARTPFAHGNFDGRFVVGQLLVDLVGLLGFF